MPLRHTFLIYLFIECLCGKQILGELAQNTKPYSFWLSLGESLRLSRTKPDTLTWQGSSRSCSPTPLHTVRGKQVHNHTEVQQTVHSLLGCSSYQDVPSEIPQHGYKRLWCQQQFLTLPLHKATTGLIFAYLYNIYSLLHTHTHKTPQRRTEELCRLNNIIASSNTLLMTTIQPRMS